MALNTANGEFAEVSGFSGFAATRKSYLNETSVCRVDAVLKLADDAAA